jgi:hypothetical protein
VDDLNPTIGKHGFETVIGRREIELAGPVLATLVAGTHHTVHLHAKASERFDMDGADKPGSDHRGADFRNGFQRVPSPAEHVAPVL